MFGVDVGQTLEHYLLRCESLGKYRINVTYDVTKQVVCTLRNGKVEEILRV